MNMFFSFLALYYWQNPDLARDDFLFDRANIEMLASEEREINNVKSESLEKEENAGGLIEEVAQNNEENIDGNEEEIVSDNSASPTTNYMDIEDGLNIEDYEGQQIEIHIFDNFTCQHCYEFARDFLPTVLESEDWKNGKLRIYWHYGSKTEEENILERASHCAFLASNKEGIKFHLELLADPAEKRINEIVEKLTMNADDFDSCLDSEEVKEKLAEDKKLIEDWEIKGVPSVRVNKKVFLGNTPAENIWLEIDKLK